MGGSTAEIFRGLTAPFPAEKVQWRVGAMTQAKDKGMALAYVDARLVMGLLDDVVGFANWQREHPDIHICRIGIRLDDDWVWRADCAGDTQIEAEKGAASTAFRRAAACWGIARYLYDLPSPWVELENKRIKDEKALSERLKAWQDRYFGSNGNG